MKLLADRKIGGRNAMTERYEFVGSGSQKFWEVTVKDAALIVRFGKIGKIGQMKKKHFPDAESAHAEKEKLVDQKTRKGYIHKASYPSTVSSSKTTGPFGINWVEAPLAELNWLRACGDTSKNFFILFRIDGQLSCLKEEKVKPYVDQIAEILLWDEVVYAPGRSQSSTILSILADYGDESVIPAIISFAEKVGKKQYDEDPKSNNYLKKLDQEMIQHAIEKIRGSRDTKNLK